MVGLRELWGKMGVGWGCGVRRCAEFCVAGRGWREVGESLEVESSVRQCHRKPFHPVNCTHSKEEKVSMLNRVPFSASIKFYLPNQRIPQQIVEMGSDYHFPFLPVSQDIPNHSLPPSSH